MSYNKVIIEGNLGRDPETKTFDSGNTVCNFTVATTETWYDNERNKQERTEWHTVNTWGKSAENCSKYLKKGSAVLLEGKLQTRKWQNKDGVNMYSTEINADRVVFIGGSKEKRPIDATLQDVNQPLNKQYELKVDSDMKDDSIPF